ncbi:MAG: TetR/AcrR family transcriptional regulator [Jatrophihabitans sp.]
MPTVPSVPRSDVQLRERLLDATETQLVDSDDDDIATRAVCDAAGVSQPVLYRLFVDKRGLLEAVVERGYDRYVLDKETQQRTADPVADLRAGWVHHMAFAEGHPAVYRLMFAPHPAGRPSARRRILDLLVEALQRVAAIGRLAVRPQVAAQAILSGNVGVALNRIAQPELYSDPQLSLRVRDAIFASLIIDATTEVGAGSGGLNPAVSPTLATTAIALSAQLGEHPPTTLVPEELALLSRWLDRLSAPE